MYTALSFGIVADGTPTTVPLDIRVRETQVVMPLMVAYIWEGTFDNVSGRQWSACISRNMLHRADPPSDVAMFEGGPVFFGLAKVRQHFVTSGFKNNVGRVEVNLRGVMVAGDLTMCYHQAAGNASRFRAEFYYDVVEVGRLQKAVAIWRTEVKQQRN